MNEIVITSIEDLDERHLVELAFHEKQFQAEILAATNKKREICIKVSVVYNWCFLWTRLSRP